jgi:hypothetical protein
VTDGSYGHLPDPVVEAAMCHLTTWVYPRKRPTDLIPVPVLGAIAWLLTFLHPRHPQLRYHHRYVRAQMRQERQKGLTRPSARSGAIHIFKHLKYNGCEFDPGELCAWALAHGWTADDAEQLGDYAEGVLTGTRYHPTPILGDATPSTTGERKLRNNGLPDPSTTRGSSCANLGIGAR